MLSRLVLPPLLAALALCGCDVGTKLDLEPERPADPRVAGPAPAVVPWFPENDSGNRLQTFVEAAWAVGEDAATRYSQAAEDLRAGDTAEMFELALKAYESRAPDEYSTRWLLVTTIGTLETEESLGFLASLAQQPLAAGPAPGHGPDPPDTVGEELIVQRAAVRALGGLLPDSEEALLQIINTSPHLSLQVAAVDAYLNPVLPAGRFMNLRKIRKSSNYGERVRSLYSRMVEERRYLLEWEPRLLPPFTRRLP